MGGGKHLLLFAVLPLLVRGQQPQVYMIPAFRHVFYGDTVYLACTTSDSSVKWYKNDKQIGESKTWKIQVKNPADGEPYQCETSGRKSDPFEINARAPGDLPRLSIETGFSDMWKGGAVILRLQHGDLLNGWMCWVYRGGEKPIMVQLSFKNNNKSIAFQTAELNVPETIYWCTDEKRTRRSNQITLTTSENWTPPIIPGEGMWVGLLVGLGLALVGLGAVLVGVVLMVRRRRTATGGVYEEVALRSRKQGDDKYETLQTASGREREYDTLSPGASGSQTKSGEYEALKKEGMKEGVYHTLGVEGAAAGGGGGGGGEGGYEALKKEGVKEGVYHTLGADSQ